MTQPILCAVDVSNTGHDVTVLKKAANLAKIEGVPLDVITVMPDFGMSVVSGFFDKGFGDKAQSEAKKKLDELVEDTLGKDANVRAVVATGSAYEEILRAAKLDDASLIVIGAHKPDYKDYLLGPNAARVVRHANCSVWVVR